MNWQTRILRKSREKKLSFKDRYMYPICIYLSMYSPLTILVLRTIGVSPIKLAKECLTNQRMEKIDSNGG